MERVTNEEVEQAVKENPCTREYCVCENCYYAYKITSREYEDYRVTMVLRCANCGSREFYDVYTEPVNISCIIDPEPHGTIEINIGNSKPESEAMGKFIIGISRPESIKVGETKPYYCFVEGKNTPRAEHCTLPEAEGEADRLARLPECIGHKVYVMQVIRGVEYCSTCKDRVPIDWNTCPKRIVRNNEEDLCQLSGKECYREECNNKVIRGR